MVIKTVAKYFSWVWRFGNLGLGGCRLIAVAIDQNNVLVYGFGVLRRRRRAVARRWV